MRPGDLEPHAEGAEPRVESAELASLEAVKSRLAGPDADLTDEAGPRAPDGFRSGDQRLESGRNSGRLARDADERRTRARFAERLHRSVDRRGALVRPLLSPGDARGLADLPAHRSRVALEVRARGGALGPELDAGKHVAGHEEERRSGQRSAVEREQHLGGPPALQ